MYIYVDHMFHILGINAFFWQNRQGISIHVTSEYMIINGALYKKSCKVATKQRGIRRLQPKYRGWARRRYTFPIHCIFFSSRFEIYELFHV